MSDPDCLFCKIIAGTIPCVKVHEDAHVIAFMDIMPQSEGHLLVVPKAHGAMLWDLEPEPATRAIAVAQRIAPAAKSALGADGVMLMQLNGAAAGQTVFHVHFHVIPRWADRELRLHARGIVDPASLAPIAARISAAISAA